MYQFEVTLGSTKFKIQKDKRPNTKHIIQNSKGQNKKQQIQNDKIQIQNIKGENTKGQNTKGQNTKGQNDKTTKRQKDKFKIQNDKRCDADVNQEAVILPWLAC